MDAEGTSEAWTCNTPTTMDYALAACAPFCRVAGTLVPWTEVAFRPGAGVTRPGRAAPIDG